MTQKNPSPRILIVDDLTQNLYTLRQLLSKLDVEIVQATSGSQALDLVLQHDFCLAIVDVQMPEMDGYELVGLLRSNQITAAMPVIFVSAIFSDEYHHQLGYEAGAVDFLSKPFSPDILLSKVKIFLQLYHQRTALEEANRALSKRAVELETGSRLGRHANSILELDVLLPEVTFLMQTMFKHYFVGIWLVEEQSDTLVLRAGYSVDDHLSLKPGFGLPLDTTTSAVVSAYRNNDSCLTCDVTIDPRYQSPKRPLKAQSELALPLQIGTNVLGVLSVQSEQADAFDRDSRVSMQMLANQIAIAIHNARLYDLEKGLRELEAQKAQELAHLNASKDRFFSIVAHDLRGPFNPLLGMVKLMTRMPDDTPACEFKTMAESVYGAARTVYELLENLLAWSRLERGRMDCAPEQVDLQRLVDRSTHLFAEVAAEKDISLRNRVPAGVAVCADPNMLNTVVRNLISNALKFTPNGGNVTVAALPDTAAARLLTVTVLDTGVGIRREDQDKLFRLDVTVSTVGTADEKGTGLGLIICKEMVKKNGGRIWIESDGTPGKGTAVKFTVPLIERPPGGWEVGPDELTIERARVEPSMEALARLPTAEKAALRELVRKGDMDGIEEWTTRIETLRQEYAPLADQVRRLARTFEEGSLLAMVQQYVEQE